MMKKGLWLLFLVGVVHLGGCKNVEVSSLWLDRPIDIDGSDAEWENAKMYIEEANLSLGLFNDAEYLYVSLVTADRNVERQIMGQGLTVWFDAKGGKNKTFGVHFPLGMRGRGPDGRPSGEDREMLPSSGGGEPEGGYTPPAFDRGDREGGMPSFDRGERIFGRVQTEMEILGPGKNDRMILPLDGKQGIEVRTGHDNDRLVYELKVPLAASDSFAYAVGAVSGKTFSIGFETPEMDRSRMPGRREGMGGPGDGFGGPGGGMGIPGGGPGGGMGGHRGGPGGAREGGFTQPKPLKLWMNVVPAVKPSVEK
jgi:hypothetical protein